MRRREFIARVSQAMESVLRKHPCIIAVYLFGSAGTPAETPLSDIDIGLVLDHNPGLMEELSLSADISSALGREDVDVVVLNSASNDVQFSAISEGDLVVDADPVRTSDFIETVLSVHKDFGLFMAEFVRDLKQGLLEDHGHGRRRQDS